MKEKKLSNRDKEKIIIITVLIVVIMAIILSIVSSKRKKETEPISQSISETETVSSETTYNEISEVTGINGENDTFIPVIMKSVIDGKTIKVEKDNKETIISLIGIEVPKEKEQEEMKRLNEILKTGDTLYLQYDENTVNEKGEELGYIWLNNNARPYIFIDCKKMMLQGILLSENLANVLSEYPNSRYEAAFEMIEQGNLTNVKK